MPTSDAHFFVRLASLWGTPSQLTALSSLSVSLSGVVAARLWRLVVSAVSCGPVSLTAPPPGPGLSLFSPYDEFKMFVRYIDIYTRAERALRPLCGYVSLTTQWPHDKPSTTRTSSEHITQAHTSKAPHTPYAHETTHIMRTYNCSRQHSGGAAPPRWHRACPSRQPMHSRARLGGDAGGRATAWCGRRGAREEGTEGLARRRWLRRRRWRRVDGGGGGSGG